MHDSMEMTLEVNPIFQMEYLDGRPMEDRLSPRTEVRFRKLTWKTTVEFVEKGKTEGWIEEANGRIEQIHGDEEVEIFTTLMSHHPYYKKLQIFRSPVVAGGFFYAATHKIFIPTLNEDEEDAYEVIQVCTAWFPRLDDEEIINPADPVGEYYSSDDDDEEVLEDLRDLERDFDSSEESSDSEFDIIPDNEQPGSDHISELNESRRPQ